MFKTVYRFNSKGFYTGEGIAQKNPEGEGYLMPPNATSKEPPEVGEKEKARFDTKEEEWEVVPDYKGEVYWTEDREKVVIDKVGIEPKEEWLTECPPDPLQEQKDEFRILNNELSDRKMAYLNLMIDDDKEEMAEVKEEIKWIKKRLGELQNELT